MKIIMIVKELEGESSWKEALEVPNGRAPEEYAKEIIDYFNSTLKQGERGRELLGIEIIDSSPSPLAHEWEKLNFSTLQDRRGMYDAYKCKNCGITGKRRSLGSSIIRDSKFSAPIYKDCRTAAIQMERNRKRRLRK